MQKQTINVIGHEVVLFSKGNKEYISLTDLAKYRNNNAPADVVKNWMRGKSTVDFLGLWEKLNNPRFKLVEFDQFKNDAGSNYFVLSPQKWIDQTNAVGMISKSGRYGGTYAHKDIAFEFASWISPEFKLYLIIEFQRLKKDENERLKLEWNLQRTLAKVNYRIHTDAIRERLIPPVLSKRQIDHVYASEADMLNVALFGMTARQWREKSPNTDGNIRDHAMMEQLVVLSNLESINAVFIHQGLSQHERLKQLNAIAIRQMKSLLGNRNLLKLQ